jgi:hypothetical protein
MIYENWQNLTAKPDRRPIWQWAQDNVQMPSVLTIHGRFNPNISRHFIPVFDALQDDHVRVVVLRKPVRGGGTLISDIWHTWCRANDPGPAMVVMQTDQMATDHSETRFMPMLLSCPQVAALLPSDLNKIRKTEIIFADGNPTYVTGPGIRKMQSKGIRYMSCDEPWLYKPGTLAEAEGRLGDYTKAQTSKLFLISQAGIEDDDFDRWYNAGHQAVWTVQCLGCQKFFPLRWTGQREDGSRWGMRWDEHKDERDMWLVEQCRSSVRYECQHCGHTHTDGGRVKAHWNTTGTYTVTAANASHAVRSFHYNAMVDTPWGDLVAEFLIRMNEYRMGVVEGLIAFFQKRIAEPKSERTLLEGALQFKRVAYGTSEWAEEVIRFMTCDRQEEDLFWWSIRAWSANGESRRVDFGRAYGFAEVAEIAEKNGVLNVFCDSGYKPKGDNGVYAACLKYGWTALKGDPIDVFWHQTKGKARLQRSYSELTKGDPESGTEREGVRYANVVRFSASTYADRLHQLIQRKLWTEPAEQHPMEAEYRKQMTSEFKKRKENKFTGRSEMVWVQARRDNHLWDCSKMQVLAATLADLLPDASEIETGEVTTPATAPQPD